MRVLGREGFLLCVRKRTAIPRHVLMWYCHRHWAAMRILGAALCLALFPAWGSGPYTPRVVANDPGGMIRSEYLPRIQDSIRARQRVVVDGFCGSACTYELRNPLMCVTPRAVLAFHASPALPQVARIPDDHWTMTLYPRHVQEQLRARGGLTHVPIVVQWPDTLSFARSC